LSERKYYNTNRLPLRPARIARAVERWFDEHQRPLPWRQTYEPYHVWVSEVMAQQTRIEVVLRYFEPFIARLPDVRSLAAATVDEVTSLWSGLGYYRRARMLREGGIDLLTRYGGKLPEAVEELQSIAGIGRYTAGAIASIAFEQRVPIVDGNIARIVARLVGIEHPAASPALMREAWKHAEELVAACREPRKLNQGLMEIGALICKPANPSCGACPLRSMCIAFASGRVDELPGRRAKAATRTMRIPLYLIVDSDGRILMRREGGKLMRDLFHLPHGDSSLLSGRALRVRRTRPLGTFRHTVTTRRIEFELMTATLHDSIADGEEYLWVARDELARLPHPSYVSKALRLAARLSPP
jgi:A/G-specific adenine glycosylase